MKNSFLFLVMIIVCQFTLFSQTCQWAERIYEENDPVGTIDRNVNHKIVVDKDGNLYLTGVAGIYSSKKINFNNGISLTTINRILFLAKYDTQGTCKYATIISNNNYEAIKSIALDDNSNIYMFGSFFGSSINFNNGISITNGNGQYDDYIAKFSNDGLCQWAKGFVGAGNEEATCIAIDSTGNILVLGNFSGSCNFGNNIKLVGMKNSDVFIAKYTKNGLSQWARQVNGKQDDRASGLSVDRSGNIFICGQFSSDSLYFDKNITMKNSNYSEVNHFKDIFLAKYDSLGGIQWAEQIKGPNDDYSTGLATDMAGNIILSGGFYESPVIFNNGKDIKTGIADAFIAKYNTHGKCIWIAQIGSEYVEFISSINSDKYGNIYASGYFSSNSTNFNNGVVLTGNKYKDAFVCSYNISGECVWAEKISSNFNEVAEYAAIDTLGNVYIEGGYDGDPLDFNNNKSLKLSKPKNNDIFLAKYSQLPRNSITTMQINPGIYCSGDSIKVPFSINGTFKENTMFVAQLSDSFGLFDNPTNLGVLTGKNAGTIKGKIPSNIKSGYYYRIRVISFDPDVKGLENSEDIIINALPTKYSLTSSGSYCVNDSGAGIKLNGSQINVSYQLYINGSKSGLAINGTGDSISFGKQNK
jgi:hypothetical protein